MTTAPPQEKSHKEPARQAPRRIVPVIPRQLARPRKQQTSGQVKEKDEVEQKVEIPAARPEVEPVTAPSHEEVRQSRKQPLDGPSVAEEDKSAVNGQTPTKEGVPAVVNGNQKTEQTPSEVKTEQSQGASMTLSKLQLHALQHFTAPLTLLPAPSSFTFSISSLWRHVCLGHVV